MGKNRCLSLARKDDYSHSVFHAEFEFRSFKPRKCGKKKQKIPKPSDTIAATKKVIFNDSGLASQAMPPMVKPEAIQPIVPQTLMPENSFSASVVWFSDIELTSAKVGIKRIMYINK